MEQGNQNYACKNILLLKVGGSSITGKSKNLKANRMKCV
jgi:hypothetical protein